MYTSLSYRYYYQDNILYNSYPLTPNCTIPIGMAHMPLEKKKMKKKKEFEYNSLLKDFITNIARENQIELI